MLSEYVNTHNMCHPWRIARSQLSKCLYEALILSTFTEECLNAQLTVQKALELYEMQK